MTYNASTLWKLSPTGIRVRAMQSADCSVLQRAEDLLPMHQGSLSHLEHHPHCLHNADPGGTLPQRLNHVLEMNSRLHGLAFAVRVDMDWHLFQKPWSCIDSTDELAVLFSPSDAGNTLFGQEMVIAESEKARANDLMTQFSVYARHRLVEQLGLKGWICFVRAAQYDTWRSKLSFKAYVQQVEAKALEDTTLSFHLSMGARIGMVIEASSGDLNHEMVLFLYRSHIG